MVAKAKKKSQKVLIEISVFIDMLSAFEFKYCSFLIETLISTFYDSFTVLHRPGSWQSVQKAP